MELHALGKKVEAILAAQSRCDDKWSRASNADFGGHFLSHCHYVSLGTVPPAHRQTRDGRIDRLGRPAMGGH